MLSSYLDAQVSAWALGLRKPCPLSSLQLPLHIGEGEGVGLGPAVSSGSFLGLLLFPSPLVRTQRLVQARGESWRVRQAPLASGVCRESKPTP